MIVLQAFRYELDPNAGQHRALASHAGAARFAYNWGPDLCRARLDAKQLLPSGTELHRLWNVWKDDNAPWWVNVSKCAPQEAPRGLHRAFRNLWRGWKGRKPIGFPRFRKKGRDDRFRLTGARRGPAPGRPHPVGHGEARGGPLVRVPGGGAGAP